MIIKSDGYIFLIFLVDSTTPDLHAIVPTHSVATTLPTLPSYSVATTLPTLPSYSVATTSPPYTAFPQMSGQAVVNVGFVLPSLLLLGFIV